jgi:excisionase family DNA binding protein
MSALAEKPDAVLPTAKETELAQEASRALAATQTAELRVRLDDGKELILPKSATRLIHYLLMQMAHGNAMTLIPIHAELTTQEAADYLNVSRPHLIRILEQKRIPYHMVGTHRRIRFEDLEAYRKDFESRRRAAMDELAKQAQELRMGY